MTIVTLTKTHQSPPVIKQSQIRRDWMDETYKKHAYQCMPMTVANVYGWELQMEEDLVVQWDGGNTPPTILSGQTTSSGREQANASIIGMVSINMGWAINTETGYSLWMSGSPNYFLDGASALTATIPSSWWPDESQMNWKITKIGEPVTFPAGSPFCFFNIYDNTLLESVEFKVENLWDKHQLMNDRAEYGEMKMKNNTENPWTWTKGIKTGLDAKGNSIGPSFAGLPSFNEPE